MQSGKPPEVREIPRWVDGLILLVVLLVAIFSISSMVQSGAFGISLTDDPQLAWHLVRAAGLTAYMLLAASTLWGLFLSTRAIKDWTPGSVSLLLHATVSWLALILGIVHVGLLLFDTYYSYKFSDLLIPFTGPYRAFAVGLGTISAWLILAITISFSFRKVIGQRAWRWLHYTSYAAFVLVTIHAAFAGTDASKPGMVIVLGGITLLIAALLYWRVGGTERTSTRRSGQSRA